MIEHGECVPGLKHWLAGSCLQ